MGELLKELRTAFRHIENLDDSKDFRQAVKFYGEALLYSLLSAKFQAVRLVAKSSSMPDFSCRLTDGKKFFVELKSFDIVDGSYKSGQMHEVAMQQQVEFESQTNRGAPLAITEREVAPYMRGFGKPDEYDPASLLTVIDARIDKPARRSSPSSSPKNRLLPLSCAIGYSCQAASTASLLITTREVDLPLFPACFGMPVSERPVGSSLGRRISRANRA